MSWALQPPQTQLIANNVDTQWGTREASQASGTAAPERQLKPIISNNAPYCPTWVLSWVIVVGLMAYIRAAHDAPAIRVK